MNLIKRADSALDDVVNQLVEIVRPVVESIEKSTPTTKDHYDQYMGAIERLVGMLQKGEATDSTYLGVALALQRAGAPKNGVLSALRALGKL